MDLHASQIQGFFDVPVDKCVLLASVRIIGPDDLPVVWVDRGYGSFPAANLLATAVRRAQRDQVHPHAFRER